MKSKSRARGKIQRRPHIFHLTRIMVYLEEVGRGSHQTEISKETIIHYRYVTAALKWLVNYGLIQVRKEEKVKLYSRSKGGKK